MAWTHRIRRAVVPTLLLLTLALGLAAQAEEPAPDAGEWVRPYLGWLPDAYDGGACLLVRDARTGKPLEGVTIQRCPEMELTSEGWAPIAGTWTTDAYGLVSVPLPEDGGDSHWVIRKTGYASTEEYGRFVHDVIDLEPGRSRHGRVVDWLGRPAAGLLVEHKIGCAHAPAIHRTRSDEDGVFVLDDLGDVGDLIISGAGVQYDYHGHSLRPLTMTPSQIVVQPSYPVTGRVETTDGELLHPRTILAMTTWRGPLALLGEDGSFRLEGSDGDSTLQLHAWLRLPGNDYTVPSTHMGRFRPGGPFVWRVGQAAEDEEDAQETSAAAFAVVGPGDKPFDITEVNFDRLSDGRRFSAASHPYDGTWPTGKAELPPGRYEASVGGPFSPWIIAPVAFTHPGADTVILTAQPQTPLVLEVGESAVEPCPQGRIYLDGASVEFDLESTLAGEHTYGLPPEARAWVVLGSSVGIARAQVGPVKDGRRMARLVFPAPHWIEIPDVWGDQEVELDMPDAEDELAERKDGVLRIAVAESGRLPLWLSHPVHGSGWIVVDVPAEGDAPAVVDLAAVQWDEALPKRDLLIVPPAGRRLDEPIVDVGRAPAHGLGSSYDEQSLEGRYQGDGAAWIRSAALRAGVDLVIKPWFEEPDPNEDWLYHRVRLEGDGPYRVEMPDGALDLEIVLADKEEDDVSVVIGGHVERWGEVKDGRMVGRLRGLVPGPHLVLVGAPGHESRVARIVIPSGEIRRFRVELPLRRP